MQTLENIHSLISQGENALLVGHMSRFFKLCVDMESFSLAAVLSKVCELCWGGWNREWRLSNPTGIPSRSVQSHTSEPQSVTLLTACVEKENLNKI